MWQDEASLTDKLCTKWYDGLNVGVVSCSKERMPHDIPELAGISPIVVLRSLTCDQPVMCLVRCSMEKMRTENSELTNRLTEAAMRASEAEAARLQHREHASQAASQHDDQALNSPGSRPSSPHANG